MNLRQGDDEVTAVIKPGHFISVIKAGGIVKEIPTTVWSYNGQSGNTYSGLYVFNPLQEETQLPLELKHRVIQKGAFLYTVDSLYKAGNFLISYQVLINNCQCPEVRKTVWTTSKVYLEAYNEIVLRTDLPHQFDSIYVDNSMTV
jgi:hypothetical protein